MVTAARIAPTDPAPNLSHLNRLILVRTMGPRTGP